MSVLLTKTFNNVHHRKFIEFLKQLHIDDEDIGINNLYHMQTSAIRKENMYSDFKKIQKVVRQGCILSPLLFNIYSEQICKK